MAQAGVGVDMLSVARVERVLERRPRFCEVAFSKAERSFCRSTERPARYFAECWAARGAVRKALGLTPHEPTAPTDICVERARGEQPRVVLAGLALERAQKQGIREIALSLSCLDDVAVASAVALTDEVRPRVEQKPNPEAELRATFKQARSVLDELERQGESKKV